MWTILLSILAGLVCLLIYFSGNGKQCKLPKGPQTVPFLGNILSIYTAKYPHLKLFQWAAEFGDLYTIYMAQRPALVVNDSKIMKQLLNLNTATGKFKTDTFLLLSGGPYGVVMTEGQTHTEQRSHLLKSLKTFGFGTRSVETILQPEIAKIVSQVHGQGRIYLYKIMKQTISNTLWKLVTGDSKSSKMANLLEEFIPIFQRTAETGLFFLPWLKYFSKKYSGYTALEKICVEIHGCVKEALQMEQASREETSEPRHLIDCYLEALKNMKNTKESSFYGHTGLINSVSTLGEVFIGGVESTAATLTWLMYYLIWNPGIARKLYGEIDAVIGDESPSLDHRQRMPYTEAVILESQRCSSVIPLGLVHELLEDVVDFQGFKLPKGLMIIPNLFRIHNNPETFKRPEEFRPERFIENLELKEHVVAFQPGKRSCPGEPLARDYMFLMVAEWFQKLRLERDPDVSREMYFDANIGFGIIPRNLPVLVRPRRL